MNTTMTLWDGREVPRVGVGCWAIGGNMYVGDTALAYGEVDDATSLAGLELAYDLGARVFDTAAAYGTGHSEELLGQAFKNRDDVVIVTKFGNAIDPDARQLKDPITTPEDIRAAVDGSRRRLNRDRIDLVLFHINEYPPENAGPVFDTLGHLRNEGKIAAFGWSTDFLPSAQAFADRPGFVAIENNLNVFEPATEVMKLVADKGLVSIARLPLAMGLLTGKYSQGAKTEAADVRASGMDWLQFFKDGAANPDFVNRLETIRELLQTEGRTLAQGALGWVLAASPNALPVPGFKTEDQIRDNMRALEKGALPQSVMDEIHAVLSKEVA